MTDELLTEIRDLLKEIRDNTRNTQDELQELRGMAARGELSVYVMNQDRSSRW